MVAPLPLLSTPTAIPLYQPIPRLTGELVVVANANGQGAPPRVAPRPLAREPRTVPEYDPANPDHDASNPDNDVVLALVGSDLKVNRVNWACVRDNQGNVGWIASHLLTTVARGPGVSVLDPALRTVTTCATATPTPTALPSIPLVVTPTPSPEPGPRRRVVQFEGWGGVIRRSKRRHRPAAGGVA